MFDHETAEIEQANLDDDALTLDELTEIMHEIEEQPYWRHIADILQEVKSLNLQKKLKNLCTKKRNNSYKVVEFL